MAPLDVKCMGAVTLIKARQWEILVWSAISRSNASTIGPGGAM
jgi:hypothetical protein